jgi:hypothetical protein
VFVTIYSAHDGSVFNGMGRACGCFSTSEFRRRTEPKPRHQPNNDLPLDHVMGDFAWHTDGSQGGMSCAFVFQRPFVIYSHLTQRTCSCLIEKTTNRLLQKVRCLRSGRSVRNSTRTLTIVVRRSDCQACYRKRMLVLAAPLSFPLHLFPHTRGRLRLYT